jgi:hypothetical protein
MKRQCENFGPFEIVLGRNIFCPLRDLIVLIVKEVTLVPQIDEINKDSLFITRLETSKRIEFCLRL